MISEDLSFLPYLLEEDLFLIPEEVPGLADKESNISTVVNVPVIQAQDSKENKIDTPVSDPIEENIIKKEPSKVYKKVLILVGYKDYKEVPPDIEDALRKIFDALKINKTDVQIVNVLYPQSPQVDDFSFDFLILMGGNGKNLKVLSGYNGARARYEIANHDKINLFFAEAMDVYMKSENLELKKKFWNHLKLLFA